MKEILTVIVFVSLALTPFASSANAQSASPGLPPIQQPLVREGDFAVELANALNLTTSKDEAAAEDSLSSVKIFPRNGWISNYPMTPDIIAEVRKSARSAASSGRLRISEADAIGAVDKVSTDMNLPVKVSGERISSQRTGSGYTAVPSADTGLYSEEPLNIENYYDEYGPPIVSYYPPPWDWYWLYDWVPGPFWWDGYGFGGFFVLTDFDSHFHGHHFTNHFRGKDGNWRMVDPVNRAEGRTASSPLVSRVNGAGHGSLLNSPANRTAAMALVSRGTGRGAVSGTFGAGTRDSDNPARPFGGNPARENTARTFNGANGNLMDNGSRLGHTTGPGPSTSSGSSFSTAPSMHAFSGSAGFGGGGFHGGGFGGGSHGGGGGRR